MNNRLNLVGVAKTTMLAVLAKRRGRRSPPAAMPSVCKIANPPVGEKAAASGILPAS
jgi:hypothetical protein